MRKRNSICLTLRAVVSALEVLKVGVSPALQTTHEGKAVGVGE